MIGCGPLQAQLTVTNNLVLWLKADALALSDGAPVSSWTDSSPSLNNATQPLTQNQPTFEANEINGLPVVRFTRDFSMPQGTNSDWLGTTRMTLSGGLTYFAVFRTTTAVFGKNYPGNAAMNIIGDHTGAVYNGFGLTGGKGEYNAYDAGWHSALGTTSVNDGKARDLIASFSPSDNTPRLFLNDLFEASTSATYNGSFIAFDRISGGWLNNFGTADFYDGDIAEVLIYNTALSGSARHSVHEYLVTKYALPEPSIASLGIVGLVALWKCRRRTG
jgi:hypothetical protein